MRRTAWLVSSFICLLLCHVPALAEKNLKTAWVENDIRNIERFLPALSRTDDHTLREFEEVIGKAAYATDLGFGASTFSFRVPGEYIYFNVKGLAVNGTIARFSIRISAGKDSWPKIRPILITAWTRNTKLAFEEGTYEIGYYREYPSLLENYKTTVASQLGSMKSLSVPPELRNSYEHLVSIDNNSVVGFGGCGYSGTRPVGKTSIDQLLSAQRIDLIENVLRGYNRGGRVYALLALQDLERSGVELSADTQNAIRVVRELEIEIDTCSGCFRQYKTAKEIIKDLQEERRLL